MNAARDLLLSNMPILQLLPAASEDEMQAVAIALDSPIPNELSEILKTTTGFTDSKRGAVRFTGHFGFEFRELFPHALPILPDGFGNFWVLDVDSNN